MENQICPKCNGNKFEFDNYWNEYACDKCGAIITLNGNIKKIKKKWMPSAWRARLAGLYLLILPLIAFLGLISSGGTINNIDIVVFILFAFLFAAGLGLVFKVEICWHIVIVTNFLMLFCIIAGFGDFLLYRQQTGHESTSLWFILFICLPNIISIILLINDSPKKWL